MSRGAVEQCMAPVDLDLDDALADSVEKRRGIS